jgi:hypothetical protein
MFYKRCLTYYHLFEGLQAVFIQDSEFIVFV